MLGREISMLILISYQSVHNYDCQVNVIKVPVFQILWYIGGVAPLRQFFPVKYDTTRR